MRVSEKQVRKVIREEIKNVINETDLPMGAEKHIGEAQYHTDQARSELLNTEYENRQVFEDLTKADRLLKRYLR